MDYTVDRKVIDTVLRNFDRRKDDELRNQATSSALEAAAAVGTSTPTTLLADIRSCIVELTGVLKTTNEEARERATQDERRHQEVLAFVSEINNNMGKLSVGSPQQPFSYSTPRRLATPQEQRKYYYGGDELKTKESIIGCVLMQMYKAASNQTFHSNTVESDASLMELKDWSSVVSITSQALSVVTPTQGKLSHVKASSVEATTACELAASTVSGRMAVCKLEHIRRLQNECPTIMQIVEEVRLRITLCPGLVSVARTRMLISMGFPFVNNDDTLNMTRVGEREGGSKVVVDTVSQLNIPQRKVYAMNILRDQMKPIIAVRAVINVKT